ncbi:heterokaryon incompatibility protein-domain-containing protein [Hypoxylon argillaceum]|nr:heterokaryon incompatibility protein-domain-containing protein [Hypoxylon argillaceum]
MSIIEESGCSVCELIYRSMTIGDGVPKGQLDLSFDEILDMNCPKHHKFFQHFKDEILSNKRRDQLWPPVRVSVGISISWDDICGVFRARWNNSVYVNDYRLVNRRRVPNHPGNGLVLDPDWINMDTIKQWRERCTTEHGSKCLNKWKIQKIAPRWLIDTHDHCLVAGSKADSYVCLSYRWGKIDRISTMQATLQEFQKPQSLNQDHIRQNISPLILHAMQVIQIIGLRYLWVDKLCIVQDDVQSTQAELNRMGAIYGSALLTIVCAYGDAERGLLGVQGVSQSRELDQGLIPFGDDTLLIYPEYHPESTGYFSRGWTYQELEMSSRALVFRKDGVRWWCQCARWDEDVLNSGHIHHVVKHIAAGIPELSEYSLIVQEYNSKTLTHDSDGLNAITGMLEAFRPAFEGGFLCGLPIMFFDLALCWKPRAQYPLRRRGSPAQQSDSTSSELPSWSWVGWQGGLDCCNYESGLWKYIFSTYRTITYPIIEWHASETPRDDSVKHYQIRPSWFEKRANMLDYNRPVPRGWKRYKYDANDEGHSNLRDHEPPMELGQYVFEHENLPGELFRHPVPVSEVSPNAEDIIPPALRYISGRTKRTWLKAYREKPEEESLKEIGLRDDAGRKVGVLYLNCLNETKDFNWYSPGKAGGGTTVELVAICRQKVEELDEDFPQKVLGDHEVYVVLWVEWSDGVAYRKAVGWVEKDDWEQHPRLESVDLVLG